MICSYKLHDQNSNLHILPNLLHNLQTERKHPSESREFCESKISKEDSQFHLNFQTRHVRESELALTETMRGSTASWDSSDCDRRPVSGGDFRREQQQLLLRRDISGSGAVFFASGAAAVNSSEMG